MTDRSTAEMRSEATRELNGMKFQKANVTKYVKKCLKLVEVFRGEQTHGSIIGLKIN